MDGIAAVLFQFRMKGVRLWAQDGQLRFQAPKAALTSDDMQTLRRLKAEIAAYLQNCPSPDSEQPPLRRRQPGTRVPLAFSQHWLRNILHQETSGRRDVYTATRLSGQLNRQAIQVSVSEVVRRHETLRTRIVVEDGIPRQEIHPHIDHRMRVVDLSMLPRSEREAAAKRHIRQLIENATDLAQEPLFEIQLLTFDDHDHVLVTALNHLITDATSACILLRDIWTLYAQSSRDIPLSLAELPIQFADYAVWQHEIQSLWSDKHGPYWDSRLAGTEHLRLFPHPETADITQPSLARKQVRFGRSLTAEVRDCSRQHRTSSAMIVLSAYLSLLSRWCGTADLVLPFFTSGRLQPELEDMVGDFVTSLPLRVVLSEEDRFIDVLRRVTQEHGNAQAHYDLGSLGARLPQPGCMRNSAFNWAPQELDVTDSKFLNSLDTPGLTLSPFDLEGIYDNLTLSSQFDQEPILFLMDTEGGIAGELIYRADRVARDTVERFERNIRFFVQMFVQQPASRVTDVVMLQ